VQTVLASQEFTCRYGSRLQASLLNNCLDVIGQGEGLFRGGALTNPLKPTFAAMAARRTPAQRL